MPRRRMVIMNCRTDRAYKNFVSGGGKVPVSTEAVADELKELYQDVMASNLSPRQKTDALAMLDALGKYSTPEHLRKTLLGIQMKGGAEAFFRRPGGSSQDELVNGQLNLRAELKGQLNQKEQELEHFTLWERAFAPSPEYRALQEQKKDIENNIRAVEDRLNRFAYGWEKGISIPDWNEVDEWEQAQLAEAAKVAEEKAKAEKRAREEAAAEAKAEAEKYGLPHVDERFSHITRETLQARLNRFTTNPQDIREADWQANLQKMWNLPLEEIIARMIIGEAGDRRVSDQDRVDICYSVIVRMLDDQRFNAGVMQGGDIDPHITLNKDNKSLKELLFGQDQFRAVNPFKVDTSTKKEIENEKGKKIDITGYLAYSINSDYLSTGDDAQRIWEQAKWMGIILAELFEDKISRDLYAGYNRDEWRTLADTYFNEFDKLLDAVYPNIVKSEEGSKITNYQNSFIGRRTYVEFGRQVR